MVEYSARDLDTQINFIQDPDLQYGNQMKISSYAYITQALINMLPPAIPGTTNALQCMQGRRAHYHNSLMNRRCLSR